MDHDCKFIETSSGIQHNVDELLVGVLKQIRLREDLDKKRRKKKLMGGSSRTSLSLSVARDILQKMCLQDNRSKSCENLLVLWSSVSHHHSINAPWMSLLWWKKCCFSTNSKTVTYLSQDMSQIISINQTLTSDWFNFSFAISMNSISWILVLIFHYLGSRNETYFTLFWTVMIFDWVPIPSDVFFVSFSFSLSFFFCIVFSNIA